MRQYELMLVLNPTLEEEGVQATVEKVKGWVSGKGGVVTSVEQRGRRKLAYPIRRFGDGHYVLTQFEGGPELSRELEGNLKFAEEVLRYLLIRLV